MGKREKPPEERHPSFGTVQFDRLQCGGGKTRLFGSHLDNHQTIIRLRISQASRRHELSQDWIHSEQRICEVDLSAAQFAELLTTMNHGDGVPCTVKFVRDEGPVEDLPHIETEQVKIRTEFEGRAAGLVADLRHREQEIDRLLSSGVSKKLREAVTMEIRMLFQEIEKDLPFVLEQFREAAEKVSTEAKAEVEAFLTKAIADTGLQALRERGDPTLPAIEGGRKPDPECICAGGRFLDDPPTMHSNARCPGRRR